MRFDSRLWIFIHTCCSDFEKKTHLESRQTVWGTEWVNGIWLRSLYSPCARIRITIGGKLLTNHLKEIVSFRYFNVRLAVEDSQTTHSCASWRQWNMMDETYVMNEVKETCCYISRNFDEDMRTSRYCCFRTKVSFAFIVAYLFWRSSARDNSIVLEYVLPDFSMKKEGRVRVRRRDACGLRFNGIRRGITCVDVADCGRSAAITRWSGGTKWSRMVRATR